MIIVLELTGEYSNVLSLMFAIVRPTGIGRRLSGDTIHTLTLRCRDITIDRPRVVSVMRTVPVAVAMQTLPEPLQGGRQLGLVVHRLSWRGDAVAVIDGDGELIGIISPIDIEQQTLARAPEDASAARLAHTARELHADDTLEQAVRALSLTDDPGLPVLAPAEIP